MYYPATLTPAEDGSGRYGVTFEDLPGCVSQGENLEDALRMGQEALTFHLRTMVADGDELPSPSSLEEARAKNESLSREEGYAVPQGTVYQYILAEVGKPEKKSPPVNLSISLKPGLLESIDSLAEELSLTRSGVIALAAREYVARFRG
jgi:predicted RNase H-like HicB family nuclease